MSCKNCSDYYWDKDQGCYVCHRDYNPVKENDSCGYDTSEE